MGAPDDELLLRSATPADPAAFVRRARLRGAVAARGAAAALGGGLGPARAAARPGDAHLFVVVEGDLAVEAALVSAGATETLRVIAMDGPLPA